MGPTVYSVTLNGAPAAASPQVNEFWVDCRLSAHPLHREEALGGEGRGQQRSPGWRGAEGVGQRGDLRGSVPVPEADLRTARGPSASVSPAYPEPQLAGPPAPSGPPAPDYRVSGPKSELRLLRKPRDRISYVHALVRKPTRVAQAAHLRLSPYPFSWHFEHFETHPASTPRGQRGDGAVQFPIPNRPLALV